MKFRTKALWALPAVMVVVAAAALVFWLRSDDETPLSPDQTSVPTATANPCPVDEAICEFAKRAEFEYREGDYRSLLSPKAEYYPESAVLNAGIGSWRDAPYFPYVIGIGCSINNSGELCVEAFSLVFTAFPEGQQSERINRVLLGFVRDVDELPIVTTNRLVGGGINIVTSGVDSGDCGLSGALDLNSCTGTRFFPYTTGPAISRPAAVPTPTPVPGDPLAGRDALVLRAGMQSSIGYDTVVYYSTGCFACGRSAVPNLFRTYRDSSGKLQTDDLFGPLLAKVGGYPTWVAADWERGHLLVQVCTTGYCGGESEASPDAAQKFFRSRDGGVTFVEEQPELPVGSFLSGFVGDKAIVGIREPRGLESTLRYVLYPGNAPLVPPAGLEGARPRPDGQGGIAWLTSRPSNGAFDATGKLIVGSSPGKPLIGLEAIGPGWLASWHTEGQPGSYYGLYDGRGELAALLRHDPYFNFAGQLPSGLLYGTIELDGPFGFGIDGGTAECKRQQPVYAALIDWNSGTIHPIHEFQDCIDRLHVFLQAMVARPVARVNTPSDCLNMRSEPGTDAPALGCFADGVLLPLRLEGAPPTVAGWLPVLSPDLETAGWVAEEFVTR